MRVSLALDTRHSTLAALLALAIFNVHLIGRAQVYADVHGAPVQGSRFKVQGGDGTLNVERGTLNSVVATPGFEPLPFDAAIEFFRSKTNVSPERFRSMELAARQKAFTIAAGANSQIRDSIKRLLDDALVRGLTMDEFKDSAADILDAAGVSERKPWYWETVYRTNMQTSYQAGRWKQMTDPDVVRFRPYIRYVSALLPTSRPSHKEKHGLVYPADHPFWDKWIPPAGFNCYCTVMSVSPSLLERRGWKVSEATNFLYPDPDPGFGGRPGQAEV